MSPSQRHRADSSPPGSDVEVERRSASDRGKEAQIESVGIGKHGGVTILVTGDLQSVQFNTFRVVKPGDIVLRRYERGRISRGRTALRSESRKEEAAGSG